MERFLMYFDFLVDLLAFDEPRLILKSNNTFYNNNLDIISGVDLETKGITLFSSSFEEVTVYIDIDRHSSNEEYLTLTHEMRHAYQVFCLKHEGLDEEPWLYKHWEKEIYDYKRHSEPEYKKQYLELDANAFTSYICNKVFNKEVKVEYTNYAYKDLCKHIEQEYADDEIRDSLEYSRFIPALN